ncbi:hypothetical protein FM036_30860, partial [Nostoc sp. HG1]|nr:hypothetical protein [Nostoc sp. HG1]
FSEARLLTPSWNWLMYITTSFSLTLDYQRNYHQSYMDSFYSSQKIILVITKLIKNENFTS